MAGTLHIVATPLGNLDDLSPRAAETLRRVAAVVCEDTRRTGRLLGHLGLNVPMLSAHKFNERQRVEALIRRLQEGESLALVSDGGTPVVSDPGSRLVDAALEAGITVSPVPGPSAVTTLLSVSGMSGDRFVFEGFLPHRGGERRRRLRELAGEERTVVVFESPHRIRECLEDIAAIFGERPVAMGRELTKLHEQVARGPAQALIERLPDPPKGEISLAIAPRTAAAAAPADDDRWLEGYRQALAEHGGDRREALRVAARALGIKRSELYRHLAERGEEG